jgi:hypothetical protein
MHEPADLGGVIFLECRMVNVLDVFFRDFEVVPIIVTVFILILDDGFFERKHFRGFFLLSVFGVVVWKAFNFAIAVRAETETT